MAELEILTCMDYLLPISLPDRPKENLNWKRSLSLFQSVAMEIANREENTVGGKTIEEWITECIGTILNLKNVFILAPDFEKNKFYVKGSFGVSQKNIESVSFSINEGICGHVLRTKHAHLANVIHTSKGKCCEHYIDIEGLGTANSEFAVPIILQDKVIGILDIQSDKPNAFSEDDVFIISSIANLVALKMEANYGKMIEQEEIAALRLIEEASSPNLYGRSSKQLFMEFAKRLVLQFDADLITFYPLAPGTGYPITPPYVFGDLKTPNYLTSGFLSKSSILFHLFSLWKPIFFEDSQSNNLFISPLKTEANKVEYQRFVIREEIVSTVFCPLGTLEERIGILFINFRRKVDFNKRRIIEIQAIASMYAIQLLMAQQRELRESSLFLGSPDIHAGIDLKLSFVLKELERSFDNDVSKNEIISLVDKKLREMMDDVLLQLSSRVGKFEEPSSLEKRIDQFIGSMNQSFQREIRIDTQISWDVFYSGTAINQAIYAIVCEAMLNAAKHGKANNISVNVAKKKDAIELIVKDDGAGFDFKSKYDDYLRKQNQQFSIVNGIFSRLNALERMFGAKTKIESKVNGWTIVTASIPLIVEVEHDDE